MASYSDSLLEAPNQSRIAFSILSSDGDLNCKPMPAPVFFGLGEFCYEVYQSELFGRVSDWGSSAMKSTNLSCSGVFPTGGVML